MTVKKFFLSMILMLSFVYGCSKDNSGENNSGSDVDFDLIGDVVTSYEDQMSSYISEGLSMYEIQAKTVEYIRTLDDVALVEESGSNITITYESGYQTYIVFNTPLSDEDLSSSESAQVPNNDAKIEMLSSINSAITKSTDLESLDNYILNNKVLVFDAFNSSFENYSASSVIVPTLQESYIPLDIDVLVDAECSLESLNNLSDYGTVIFFTHGVEGERIVTGTKVSFEEFKSMRGDYNNQILYETVVEERYGFINLPVGYITVDYNYLNTVIVDPMPNTLVFNVSCESFKSSKLSDVFLKKGASAYFGFSTKVYISFAGDMASLLFSSMLPSNKYPKSLLESIPYYTMHLIKDKTYDGKEDSLYVCNLLYDGNQSTTYGYVAYNYKSVNANLVQIHYSSNLDIPVNSTVTLELDSSGEVHTYSTAFSYFTLNDLEYGTEYTLSNIMIERSDGSVIPLISSTPINFTTANASTGSSGSGVSVVK